MLTDKEYWNEYYKKEKKEFKKPVLLKILQYLVRKILNENILNYMKINYSSYFLWDVLFTRYLNSSINRKVIEIGSAPGGRLIKFHEKFNMIPYGVEYSKHGVKINRENFKRHNLDAKKIIYADFFSKDFQQTYSNFFDIVFSTGFIEHFTNVKKVIYNHLNILKKKGIFIIIIPNLRGVNLALANFFLKESIAKHNLKITNKKVFQNLFDKDKVELLYCDYFGVFNVNLFYTKKRGLKSYILRFMRIYINRILNLIFRILFKEKGFDSSFFSPYLIFIGIKK